LDVSYVDFGILKLLINLFTYTYVICIDIL